jgi:hypothetical protein
VLLAYAMHHRADPEGAGVYTRRANDALQLGSSCDPWVASDLIRLNVREGRHSSAVSLVDVVTEAYNKPESGTLMHTARLRYDLTSYIHALETGALCRQILFEHHFESDDRFAFAAHERQLRWSFVIASECSPKPMMRL